MTLTNNKPIGTLGESLVQMQVISAEQLQAAQAKQKEQGGKLSEILLELGFIKVEELASFLSIMWKIPLIDLKTHVIQPEALALIPEELARKHLFIPLQIIGDSLMVVMADPDDYIAIGDIFTKTNMKVQVAFANVTDIRRAIDIYYRATDEIQEKVNEFRPAVAGDTKPPISVSKHPSRKAWTCLSNRQSETGLPIFTLSPRTTACAYATVSMAYCMI